MAIKAVDNIKNNSLFKDILIKKWLKALYNDIYTTFGVLIPEFKIPYNQLC